MEGFLQNIRLRTGVFMALNKGIGRILGVLADGVEIRSAARRRSAQISAGWMLPGRPSARRRTISGALRNSLNCAGFAIFREISHHGPWIRKQIAQDANLRKVDQADLRTTAAQ